ncbi:MAG: hypothetical protein ACPW61_05265 [Methyloligella sp. ZOD6]
MQKVARDRADLLEKYNQAGRAAFAKATAPRPAPKVAKAVQDFRQIADKIASERKISRTAAMQIARKEYPDAFAAYQAA